jgi:hypothetical protein
VPARLGQLKRKFDQDVVCGLKFEDERCVTDAVEVYRLSSYFDRTSPKRGDAVLLAYH